MTNKTVIITGAAGNLGRVVADRFAKGGYSVIAVIQPGQKMDFQFADGTDVHAVELSDESKVEEFVRGVAEKYGSIDAALLLAGGYAGGDIGATDHAQLKSMIALNFETAFYVARHTFVQMSKQPQGGRIVVVGAKAALDAKAGKGSLAYSLSKSMLFTLASLLNAEGADKNIVTSVIVPSTIDTPANRAAMPKADFSKWVKPEKIADVVLFAVSPEGQPIVDPVFKVYGNASEKGKK